MENEASYDSRFCYATTLHIDVYSGKVLTIFIINAKTPIFGKNTKAIVHGIVKNGVLAYVTESNHFMLGCTSICPETTGQNWQS